MANNNLTAKEVTLISDILTMEECACKKAKLYAKTLTDKALAQMACDLAAEHEKRFNAILNLLG